MISLTDAKSELDALLPEIEAALEHIDDDATLNIADRPTIVADSRLVELRSLVSADFDFRKLGMSWRQIAKETQHSQSANASRQKLA